MNLSSLRLAALSVCLLGFACGGSAPQDQAASSGQAAASPAPEETLPAVPDPYDLLPAETRGLIHDTFTGDLDEMIKRRVVRAGVAINRTHYFIDKGVQ